MCDKSALEDVFPHVPVQTIDFSFMKYFLKLAFYDLSWENTARA